ncbi:MAG TPA: prepilin-type N-terminal cleavage/methylation domain-containing protein [Candidatus Ozemobacteraceae bacterium]|nr:prepilin-type N-terminal cleavage/methylation domain-containing protein [Candidatus Ozemobacteraceae bacterium]
MNTERPTNSRTGFTLVEVLVAAAVFSLFLGGLFTLYRMGSGMFQAGSWKFQKQKDGERFLAILKERLEQASHAAVVDPTGSPQLTESLSRLGFVNGTINRSTIGNATTRLLLFVICKPSIGTTPGLLAYQGLRAIPTPGQAGLFNLQMISTTNVNHTFFAGTSFPFFPNGAPTLSRFNQAGGPTPGTFRLGGDPDIMEVTECSNLVISHTGGVASESLLSLTLEFKHPNPHHDKTHVIQKIVSRLEVQTASFSAGGL